MQGKQFYLKTFLTISVFSFFISYCIYESATYLKENVENSLSIGSSQFRHDAAVIENNAGINHESPSKKYVSNKSPRKYTSKYLKTINSRKMRRELFSISPTKNPNITIDGFDYFTSKPSHNITIEEKQLRSSYLKKLKLTKKEIQDLEKRTKRRHECKEWNVERKKRLTSSKFGKASRLWSEDRRRRYVYFLVNGYNKSIADTIYYRASEDVARKQLQEILGKEVRTSGLIVDYHMPYLAASPDGLVGNDSLVEIKCPYEAVNMTPQEAIRGKKIRYCRIINGRLHLKRHSNYFYQIQGQMHISSKSYGYFCVWTPKGLMYELIKRNETFWQRKMERKLSRFYLFDLLPELIKHSAI